MRNFHLPGRSQVYASNGMCATSHPLGAQVSIDILKRGGTAMDAAIAGALVLGICEPQMTGIGGDLFALISPAGSNDIHAYNGSGSAPVNTNADTLRAQGHTNVRSISGKAHMFQVRRPPSTFRKCRDFLRFSLPQYRPRHPQIPW